MAGFADSSVILLAGLIAGMMNAAAGGGSFVTVPASLGRPQSKSGARLQRHFRPNAAFLLAVQFILGIYGAYFGGAVGILMMAVWSVLGLGDGCGEHRGGDLCAEFPDRRGVSVDPPVNSRKLEK